MGKKLNDLRKRLKRLEQQVSDLVKRVANPPKSSQRTRAKKSKGGRASRHVAGAKAPTKSAAHAAKSKAPASGKSTAPVPSTAEPAVS